MRTLILLAAVAGLLFVFREPLLRRLGAFLIVKDPDVPADAIVVLSGSLPDRILHGVDLYKQGLAPRLILSREIELPGLEALRARGVTIPERDELNRSIATQLGVPPEAIVTVDQRSASTITELAALLPELRRQGVKSILLVTSKTHSRRAGLIFETLARGEIALHVSPTPYDPFDADDWWHRREMTRRALTEYGKLFTFYLADRWRGTPAPEAGKR